MSEAHPLTRHQLYGVPCPPPPDFWYAKPEQETTELQVKKTAFFVTVVDWMLVNYAYREAGGAISLVDGKISSLADLREGMAKWELSYLGKRDALKTRSPVSQWRNSRARLSICRAEKRSDRTWPIFTEDGRTVFNHYRPPTPSTSESDSDAAGRERRLLPGPSAPLEVAERFFADTYTLSDGNKSLYRWRGSWWCWEKTQWREVEESEMRAQIYHYTGDAVFLDANGEQDWAPNAKRVSEVLDALASVCLLASAIGMPSWLDGRPERIIVACENGLLDVTTRVLHPHTPLFFNCCAVRFDYDSEAAEPKEWIAFLGKIWPDSPESAAALEEWIGYLVAGLLYLQKIMLLVGPTRSGKGTIARLISKLLGGAANVIGTSFDDMGDRFGLQTFIGKSLAVISDAHFVGKDVARAVERMLSISGEDPVMINRKGEPHWNGVLPTRLMILANKLPRLNDASIAIVGRMIILQLTKSWLGKEDHKLGDKLERELPGILIRSLDALTRLLANKGNFTPVVLAEEVVELMSALSSPVMAYARERCEFDPAHGEEKTKLYHDYTYWCRTHGHVAASYAVFCRDLLAAYPTLITVRPWEGEGEARRRVHKYAGIRIALSRGTIPTNVTVFPARTS